MDMPANSAADLMVARTENGSIFRDYLMYQPIKYLVFYMALTIFGVIAFGFWDYHTIYGVLHSGSLDAMGQETLSPASMMARALLTLGMAAMSDILLAQNGWKKWFTAIPIIIVIAVLYSPVAQMHAGDVASVMDQSGFMSQAAVQGGAGMDGTTLTKVFTVLLTLGYCLIYMVPSCLFAIALAAVWKVWKLIKLNRASESYLRKDHEADELRAKVEHLKTVESEVAARSANLRRQAVKNGIDAYTEALKSRIVDIESRLSSTAAITSQDRTSLRAELNQAKDVLTVANGLSY